MESLAQQGDVMFERNIAHIARAGREVQVWVEGIPEPRIGFVAGLDEQFLQVCLSQSPNALANLGLDYVISVEETGMTLGLYAKAGEDPEALARIKDKVNPFRNHATQVCRQAS